MKKLAMKQPILILVLLMTGLQGWAQDENYVRSTQYRATNAGSAVVTEQYFDGLGRPTQTVAKSQSPENKDIVSVVTYDDFGRQDTVYLPYTRTSAVGSDTNWETNIDDFYSATEDGVANEATNYYSHVTYEPSPLNRVTQQYGPGSAWSSRPVEMSYETVGASEVKLWQLDPSGLPEQNGHFAAGSLYKNITEDENNHEVVEYIDKQGRTILKRVEDEQSNGLTTDDWLDTYYVYDDFGNLRYVLPPYITRKNVPINVADDDNQYHDEDFFIDEPDFGGGEVYVSEAHSITLGPGFSFTATSNKSFLAATGHPAIRYGKFKDLAFEYLYDERQRMIAKKVPGADWVYMVYDQWDRLVLTQDGNQRSANEWTFTKYDQFNRPVMTGITTDTRSRDQIQKDLKSQSASARYVSRGGSIHEYNNVGYPSVSNNDVLTVTYYDSYPSFMNSYTFEELNDGYPDSDDVNPKLKGQVTASKTKVLDGTNTYLKSVIYYDDKYRPIQTFTENHMGGYDQVTNKYLFSGEVEKTKRYHSSSIVSKNIEEIYTYDHVGRLESTLTIIDGKSSTVAMSYNELGELTAKDLAGIQNVDYAYNIRGWLTKINNGTTSGTDKFGMELTYIDTSLPVADRQYNGNISKMKWKSLGGDNTNDQTYTYTYDPVNRLKGATYSSANKGGHYDVSNITYDANGNIHDLTRKMGGHEIDVLDYDYYESTSPNRLSKVSDGAAANHKAKGFKDGTNSGNDYAYDANGNMISDANKGISSITYNYMNLPQSVVTPGGTVTYTYDAAGTKLKKVFGNDTTEYVGGIHYEMSQLPEETEPTLKLSFIQTAEGRYNYTTSQYEYNLTDHLGNVRVTVSKENQSVIITQTDDYYPFGLTFNSFNNDNKYLYNGKELQDETGWLDYGARMMDPTIGRFLQIDPLANVMQESWNPYHYVKNNPIKYIDPTGMIWKDQKEADDLIDKVLNRLGSVIESRAKAQYKLNNDSGLSDKQKSKLQKKIDKLDGRVESLQGTISDVVALGADQDHVYDLVSGDNQGSGKHGVTQGEDGVINIYGSNDGLHVHEIKHVSLSLVSAEGLSFDKNNNLLGTSPETYGADDEVAGYKAQYGYTGSGPGAAETRWGVIENIANLKDDNGNYVYPDIRNKVYLRRQQGIRASEKYQKKIQKGKTVKFKQ
ncbi:RHS repeat-associated core domain-containing protein [Reichenbachiella ulvae]|uniref:RHS repeat-associated core domain-containing protein n=1 Tax=Reichenbachiella ulvae TaxID=2980104 RepID=A0ABT3CUV4_9BACT|nr:RHS repeat-associated core domain-containing protein [Reichenbachiella ulvae]MCV9387475.1 RHS repeat-associated core domain-containing protein [Reichenbachiella ulvae]